jgi:hypothetical protein
MGEKPKYEAACRRENPTESNMQICSPTCGVITAFRPAFPNGASAGNPIDVAGVASLAFDCRSAGINAPALDFQF